MGLSFFYQQFGCGFNRQYARSPGTVPRPIVTLLGMPAHTHVKKGIKGLEAPIMTACVCSETKSRARQPMW